MTLGALTFLNAYQRILRASVSQRRAILGLIFLAVIIRGGWFCTPTSLTLLWLKLFEAVQGHWYLCYWGLGAVLTSCLILWGVAAFLRSHEEEVSPVEEFGFCLLLVAVILAWRWPLLGRLMENLDETLILWSGMKLWENPLAPIEAGTHGPLSPMSVFPLRLLGFKIDYGLLKTTGTLMLSTVAVMTYLFLRSVFSPRCAKIAVLPLPFMLTWGLLDQRDLRACNAEHFVAFWSALAIGSVALWLPGLRQGVFDTKTKSSIFLSGMLLGAIPFTKMQGAYWGIALAVMLAVLIYGHTHTRRESWVALLFFVAGGLVTIPLFALWVWTTGGAYYYLTTTARFLTLYISPTTLHAKYLVFREILRGAGVENLFLMPFGFGLTAAACGVVLGSGAKHTSPEKKARWRLQGIAILLALTALAVMAYSITVSGRIYPHYVVNLCFPLGLFCAMSFCYVAQELLKRRTKIAACIIMVGLLICAPYYGRLREWSGAEPRGPIRGQIEHWYNTDILATLAMLADPAKHRMHTWGTGEINILSGITDCSVQSSLGGPLRFSGEVYFKSDFLRAMYVNSLQASAPEFVADVTKPGATWIVNDPVRDGIHTYQPIFDWIKEGYRLHSTSSRGDLYVRTDFYEDHIVPVNVDWHVEGMWKEKGYYLFDEGLYVEEAWQRLGYEERAYGSWCGSDANTCRVLSEFFPLPYRESRATVFSIALARGATVGGSVWLELYEKEDATEPQERILLSLPPSHHSWKTTNLDLTDYARRGCLVRIGAVDIGKDQGQWLALKQCEFRLVQPALLTAQHLPVL